MALSESTRRMLLGLARRTIVLRVESGVAPRDTDLSAFPPNDETRAERGCFVSLHHDGELLGCIGNIRPVGTLHDAVIRNAVAAATRDPRFRPVRPDELPRLDIEISALTPLEPFASPDEIRVGVHGVFLSASPCQGVLLPQVATQYGWTAEEFLRHTAVKAGLPPDAWRTAQLFRFSAEVFSEKEMTQHDQP